MELRPDAFVQILVGRGFVCESKEERFVLELIWRNGCVRTDSGPLVLLGGRHHPSPVHPGQEERENVNLLGVFSGWVSVAPLLD